VSYPGNRLPADVRIRELLQRAGTWLSTRAIIERTGINEDHVSDTLQGLKSAGVVLRRDDPENKRRAEWRVA